MPVANRDMTRAINQFNVLNEIRRNGLISRVEIAERTGQSRASVTNITALLIKRGIIKETACSCPPTRGRRRVMLALNSTAAHVVGVKISAYQVSFAVVDFTAAVKSSLIVPIRTGERPESFVADVIEEGVRHCVAEAKLEMADIAGIGIGIPGFVDSKTRTSYWVPLYKTEKTSLSQLIGQRLGVEVYVENDANAVTVGQQWFGQGADLDDFLVVTIEHGVGMGIVVDGKLYRGSAGIGAEFGHMVIRPGGEPCRCGKLGCIEAYASDTSIVRRAREKVARRRKGPRPETLTIEDVVVMAENGDAAMRKLFREAGEVLALGVAGLIQIFNPQRIIITGEGVKAGELRFLSMRRSMKHLLNKEMARFTEVSVQEWADDDWARGAAGLVLSELYKSPLEMIPMDSSDRTWSATAP